MTSQTAVSDGGTFLLVTADQALGVIERLSQCLHDNRNPGSVVHSYLDMLRQRVGLPAYAFTVENAIDVRSLDRMADKPDQYLFYHVLQPGDSHATCEAIEILKRIIARLRKCFPGA